HLYSSTRIIAAPLPTSELVPYTTLFRSRDRYEAHHRVKILDDALRAASELSNRYITDRYLPDKAIDLIDEAASMIRLKSYTAPEDRKSTRLNSSHVSNSYAVFC